MKRVSEMHLITLILLFVVFAFLMQGRAHGGVKPQGAWVESGEWPSRDRGAGPYKAECRKTRDIEKKLSIQTIFGGCFVGGVRVSDDEKDKDFAEDIAFALNLAHEQRTTNRVVFYQRDCASQVCSNGGCELTIKPCLEKGREAR